MAEVQTAEREMRGGEERSERRLVASNGKDSNEREDGVSSRMQGIVLNWCEVLSKRRLMYYLFESWYL